MRASSRRCLVLRGCGGLPTAVGSPDDDVAAMVDRAPTVTLLLAGCVVA